MLLQRLKSRKSKMFLFIGISLYESYLHVNEKCTWVNAKTRRDRTRDVSFCVRNRRQRLEDAVSKSKRIPNLNPELSDCFWAFLIPSSGLVGHHSTEKTALDYFTRFCQSSRRLFPPGWETATSQQPNAGRFWLRLVSLSKLTII